MFLLFNRAQGHITDRKWIFNISEVELVSDHSLDTLRKFLLLGQFCKL
jgi:hypothetical protein